ncbi:MAG: hypothetical protein ABJB05_06500 [Parafilimonas sp.]
MPSYRYPGPRPFEENDINLFFGRDKDKKNLLTFINVEQMLVVFSKSGLGKSSLINAAIIPELRKKNYEIILCRFNSYVNKEAEENTNADLVSPLQKLFNEIAVNQLAGKLTAETTFLDNLKQNQSLSLWHQFKNLQIYNSEKKTYFIFFDQFEELFTYPKEQVKEFKEHLAELLNASIPQEYLDKINEVENDTAASDLTNDQLSLLYDPIPVKILCTIRSDKFSLLTNLKDAIPGIVTKTYELKPFNTAEATEAIRMPASMQNNIGTDDFIADTFTYDDDAIKKMLAYLSDDGTEDIESFQLQVLCRYVEDMVIENKKNGSGISNITVNQLGDIKNIFEAYYNKLIESIDKDKIQNVKKLFEDGLIFEKDKIRVSLYEGQIEASYGVDETLLNKLVGTHLIRCEQDTNGKEKYELSHDSLIEPILKAKEIRIEEEKTSLQKLKFKKRVVIFGAIAIGIFAIFAIALYMFSQSSKRDNLKVNFLVAEKDWFYLLDTNQRKNVLKNNFLFSSTKDSSKYQTIKYAFKCAALANLNSETDYLLALKFAQEGYIKYADTVTAKSLDSLLRRPDVAFASMKIPCNGIISSVKVTQDKKNIIAATTDGIFWYDATSGALKNALTEKKYTSDYSAFSAKGDYLLYESFYSDTTFLLNTGTKQLQFFVNVYDQQPHSIAFDVFSGDDKFFAHADGAHKINIYSLQGDLEEEYTLPIVSSTEKINELSISPDGTYIAAATDKGWVFLIDRENKTTEDMSMEKDTSSQMQEHFDIVNSVSFSHDGKFVLTGSSDKNVDIWDVKTHHLVQTLKNINPVLKCRFANSDSVIIVGENSDGIITKWTKGKTDSTSTDQSNSIGKSFRSKANFTPNNLQLIGLDSAITNVNFYSNDSKLIASSKHEISVWNLNQKTITASQVVIGKSIPLLQLKEKALWNMVTPNDLNAVTKKQEILNTLITLNDSLHNLNLMENAIKTYKQTFIDYTNLMPELYNQLQYCKDDEFNKLDSFNLFIYMGNAYYYKVQLDKSDMNGKFDRSNLYSLIHFRQVPFALDTLQNESFHNLFDAYAIPIAYCFKIKNYDSLIIWNNKILSDNPELIHIDKIKSDLMIWYQYNVSFKILDKDIPGAKKSFAEWPDKNNVSYLLTKELVEIYTNPGYHFNKTKFSQVFSAYDLKDDYNRQNINDMDAVLIRLLDEEDNRALSENAIDNITDFDNYIYAIIQK